MPSVVDDSTEAQNDRHNPAIARDLTALETSAAFDDIANNYHQTADDTQENANIAAVREGETTSPAVSAGWQSNVTGKSAKPSKPKFFSKAFWTKGNLKKKGPLGLIISLLLLGGIGGSMVMLPGIGVVHFKETLLNNLDTQIGAVDARGVKVMAAKVQGGASVCGDVISIRCKFSSLSDRRIAKFEKNGFSITKAASKIPGRSAVTAMSFTDSSGKVHAINNPGDMRNLLASNANARSSFRSTYNSRFENFAGKAFGSVMRKIPGFSKAQKIPDTKDPAKISEAVKKTTQGKGVSAASGMDPAGDNEDERNSERRGKTDSSTAALNEEAEKVRSTGTKAVAGAFKGAARGVGILGVVDSACVAKNTLKAVEVGAKVIRAQQLVNFASLFLTGADASKAGDMTPNQVEALGNMLTATDNNKTITVPDEQGNSVEQPNPYYRKSAFDSLGYKMAAYGDVPSHNFTSIQYLVGGTPAIGVLSGINDALSSAPSDTGCTFITNPITRIVSGTIGIVAGIGSFGASTIIIAGSSIAISAVIPYLESLLIDMAAGVAVDGSTVGPAAGDAATSGTGYMTGLMAQANGMQPNNGSSESIAYHSVNKAATNADIDYQSQLARATPWDVRNPYSVAGKVAGALIPSTSRLVSGGTLHLSELATMPLAMLQGTLRPSSASAASQQTGCDDESYATIGITAGGMCQVGFYMTDAELAMDPIDNLDWMIESGNVDEATGDPKGDYARFVEMCVERTEGGTIIPFGSASENGKVTDGSECLDTSKNVMPNISHFRVYTMDRNLSDGIDYERAVEATPVENQEVPESDTIVASGNFAAPTKKYSVISQVYGNPVDYPTPVPGRNGKRYGHNGVDISGTQKPEAMYAACDGVLDYQKATRVNTPGWSQSLAGREGTEANVIVIDCGGGITFGYHHAHLDGAQKGASVKVGDKIGVTDTSGTWFGYHVHFTMKKNGSFQNPLPFLKEKGVITSFNDNNGGRITWK